MLHSPGNRDWVFILSKGRGTVGNHKYQRFDRSEFGCLIRLVCVFHRLYGKRLQGEKSGPKECGERCGGSEAFTVLTV